VGPLRPRSVSGMDSAQLIADAKKLVAAEGEELVYKPRSGGSRTILGIVDREAPRAMAESPEGVPAYSMTIVLVNQAAPSESDGVGGISSAELDTGGDKITVALRIGGDAKDRPIAEILGQDEGMLDVGVR